MKNNILTQWDRILIVVLVFVILFCFLFPLFQSGGKIAVVTVGGETVCRLPLRTDITETVTTKGGFNTVVIQKGACYISSADCRDGICIHRGRISKTGESIVCLPHQLIVEIR